MPVFRRVYALPLDVFPPGRLPQFLPLVSPALDELGEGSVRDRGSVDEKFWQVHPVGVSLVVEGPNVVVGAHDERAAQDGDHLFLDRPALRELDAWGGLVALTLNQL